MFFIQKLDRQKKIIPNLLAGIIADYNYVENNILNS